MAPTTEPGPDPALRTAAEGLLLGGPPRYTRAEVAEQAGVPLPIAEELWHALGFPHQGDDVVAFTDDDVTALAQCRRLIEAGILGDDARAALVRTWGRSFARLADWQVGLMVDRAREGADLGGQLGEFALDVLPVVEDLQRYVWRRHLASAVDRVLVRAGDGESSQIAVGFVDIVGYTSRSRTLSDAELVAMVEHFEATATSAVVDHQGRVIKTIGDEILYVADDPLEAVRVAQLLVERSEEDERFPEVRAGVAFGDVVARLGDVFGPTVNIASRLTSIARPGRVLVDTGVHDALEALDAAGELRLKRLRRTSVKGYSRLESWVVRRPRRSAAEDAAEVGVGEDAGGVEPVAD